MSHELADALVFGALVAFLGVLSWRLVGVRAAYQSRLERLERLNQAGRVLLTDRNIRGVMRHLTESAAGLLGCDRSYVVLGSEQDEYLILEAATGPLAPAVGSAMRAEGTMPGWVLKQGEPLIVNDAGGSRRFTPLLESAEARNAAVLPLLARGRCIGALAVENRADGGKFEAHDVALLRELADYAAIAVESLRAVEELSGRERRAALINSVNSRIRHSLDLQVILDTAVRELGSALGVSRCYVRLRRGGELLPLAAEWAAPEVSQLGSRQDPAAPMIATALRERRTVAVTDARNEAAVRESGATPALPLGVLTTPIILRGESVGVLTFHQVNMPRRWSDNDLGLVEEVAAELAIGIANARLYRSIEDASRDLAQKISELERANRLKAQFLANMSHELRTPLNSVIGFSELLLAGAQGELTSSQRDALDTIARNGRHLLGLVNDILDLSKVEAGRMELHLVATDVRELVPDVLAGLEAVLKAKGHAVRTELPEGPLTVVADEMRLRQVLFNLLSNAVKFTPPSGTVTIAARECRVAAGSGPSTREHEAVRIEVVDTGIGIAPEDQGKLFTEFSQVDASHARRYEGTGLGLALCKRIVELHGGRIGVESALGSGSTFWVEFPVAGPPSPLRPAGR